ncbi:MAG: branched-chain-amino-acid transaminase [Peptococcaceae bacterium]|nr:branched-chain-amino-acid transaminase [Peptococcaceae bacterium]
MIIYCDGHYVGKDDAKISVFNHGFLYGDGVFEGIRSYNNRVFRLKEHIDRIYNSANSILLDIGISRQEMIDIVVETVRRNKLKDAYIRLVVARGDGDLGLDPLKCPKPAIYCIAGSIVLYPEETYTQGLKVQTVSTRRNIPSALNPQIKSLNYLNNIMAKIEANRAGVLEAIMLTQEGYVCECTGDNLFLVKKGVLLTPPPYIGALQGITRNAVIELAQADGIDVREPLMTLYDVYTADECFLTGTAAELIPVIDADGRTIGNGTPGPVFKRLLEKFRGLTQVDGEAYSF